MGTETWIISLLLSDSILYLKIIHPPNFREEPEKLLISPPGKALILHVTINHLLTSYHIQGKELGMDDFPNKKIRTPIRK